MAYGAHGASRAIGCIPVVLVVGVKCLIQYRLGGNFCHLERLAAELAVSKVAVDQAMLPTLNDSMTLGTVPLPTMSSVERPPMSITSLRSCEVGSI